MITIEDAVEAQSFHELPFEKIITQGNPEQVLESCDMVITRKIKTGSQEHFYLETQACLVVPGKEDGEVIIHSATQNPSETQKIAAHVLGVEMNKVPLIRPEFG